MDREAVILVGKNVARNVALSILDSIDPEVYRDMVRRYPDIDPDFIIEGSPANADLLLAQYTRRHENSKEVLEVAAESLAGTVYAMIGEESKMTKQKLSPEVASRLGYWVEDTLANVDCSDEHEAAVPNIIIEDNKASIPFTYKAAGVKVEGVVLFDDLDSFAETVGHYAAEAGDGDLLEQMISIASCESRGYLLSLKEDMLGEE